MALPVIVPEAPVLLRLPFAWTLPDVPLTVDVAVHLEISLTIIAASKAETTGGPPRVSPLELGRSDDRAARPKPLERRIKRVLASV